MASAATLLYQLLKADATVAALVAGRIYPLRLGQGALLPAIAYQKISDPSTGSLRACDLPRVARVQISLFTKSYAQLDELDAAVQAALDESARLLKGLPITPLATIAYLDGHDLFEDPTEVFFRPTDYRVELAAVTI
jgi:hypothetical protein